MDNHKGVPKKLLLEIENIKKFYPIKTGLFRKATGTLKAVDGVTLRVLEGETLGLVGESGCGKTTLGRCIIRAIEPSEGIVKIHLNEEIVEITALRENELRNIRRYMQMIFQDPFSSLDPRMTVLDIVGEPLRLNKIMVGKELENRVRELMSIVGLDVKHLKRYPHAFSGGQRQRIGIARALATNPKLVVCDEAVSALDVSIQAQILNLLQDLQNSFDLTLVFVAHDLSVIEHISDRVAVMYVGKVVELTETSELFENPKHPYTEALMSAVPTSDPDIKSKRIILEGEVANPANVPSGCSFHPRCRYAVDICKSKIPDWREVAPSHWVSCHLAKELQLKGVEPQ